MQSPGSAWRCNPRFLFIVKEKISEKGPFFDESNKYKFIYVPQGIFSKKTFICDVQCFLIFSREFFPVSAGNELDNSQKVLFTVAKRLPEH